MHFSLPGVYFIAEGGWGTGVMGVFWGGGEVGDVVDGWWVSGGGRIFCMCCDWVLGTAQIMSGDPHGWGGQRTSVLYDEDRRWAVHRMADVVASDRVQGNDYDYCGAGVAFATATVTAGRHSGYRGACQAESDQSPSQSFASNLATESDYPDGVTW